MKTIILLLIVATNIATLITAIIGTAEIYNYNRSKK